MNKSRDTQIFHDRCTDCQNLVVTKLQFKQQKKTKQKNFTNLPCGNSLFRLFIQPHHYFALLKRKVAPKSSLMHYQILKFGVAHVETLRALLFQVPPFIATRTRTVIAKSAVFLALRLLHLQQTNKYYIYIDHHESAIDRQ